MRLLRNFIILLSISGCRESPVGPSRVLSLVSGGDQEAVVGDLLQEQVVFRFSDNTGGAIPGARVRFTVAAGSGSVAIDEATSDLNGEVSPRQWVIDTIAGMNTLHASVEGTSITAEAKALGVADSPAKTIPMSPMVFAGLVGYAQPDSVKFAVTDRYGNPTPFADLTWRSTGECGVSKWADASSDGDAVVLLTGWRSCGSVVGLEELLVMISTGGPAVVASYRNLGSLPMLHAMSPQDQGQQKTTNIGRVPVVRVTDGYGVPISGIPVSFSIVNGNTSQVTGGSYRLTDSGGLAAPIDWIVRSPEKSVLQAVLPGFEVEPLRFSAIASDAPFSLELVFLGEWGPVDRDMVVAGAEVWSRIITGDIPDVSVNLPPGLCAGGKSAAMSRDIDDVLVFVTKRQIDGESGVIAGAGQCVRRTGSLLTAIGDIIFDGDDLARESFASQAFNVVKHELGHVLGFGTAWRPGVNVVGLGGPDPHFLGTNALIAWQALGMQYVGFPLPLENTGPLGTRDVHWREAVMSTELMTGFIEGPGVSMPLSIITIGAMRDLGYQVDTTQGDEWDVVGARLNPRKHPRLHLNEVLLYPKYQLCPSPVGVMSACPVRH